MGNRLDDLSETEDAVLLDNFIRLKAEFTDEDFDNITLVVIFREE